jgi:hypothetical protein
MIGAAVGACVVDETGSAVGGLELGCTIPTPQAERSKLRLTTRDKKMIAFAFLIALIP